MNQNIAMSISCFALWSTEAVLMYYDDNVQVDVDITGLLEGSKWFRYQDGHHPQ